VTLTWFALGVAAMSLSCYSSFQPSGFMSFWGKARTEGIERHSVGAIEYSAPFLMLEVSNGDPKDC